MDRKGGNEPKPGSAPGRKTRGLDIDFRLATFNVLTDGADWMPFVGWLMKSEKRFQTTLDMLSDLGASVVGLNECTENFHAKLQAHPLASRYHVYHTPLKPMGNMLLAKREIKDFKSVKIPRLKREVACGVVHDGETRVLAAAAHLTARSDARCVERRKTELRYLVKTCATAFKGKFDSLVIMGDLNFHVSEENKQLETLHAHAEGYALATTSLRLLNPNPFCSFPPEKRVRKMNYCTMLNHESIEVETLYRRVELAATHRGWVHVWCRKKQAHHFSAFLGTQVASSILFRMLTLRH
mmetsp:Transcript_14632/g.27768  ORF Transcript_14632/g.27768 Transcript_14632/m.27768 type:complete len:297 (-) Transcript_14632:435-1325(-)